MRPAAGKRIFLFSCSRQRYYIFRCSLDLSTYTRDRTHDVWVDLEDGAGKLHLLISISGLTTFEPIQDLANYCDPEHKSADYKWRYIFSNINNIGHLTVKLFCAKVR